MSRRKGVSESSPTFKASSSTNLLLGACYFASFHSKLIQLSLFPLRLWTISPSERPFL